MTYRQVYERGLHRLLAVPIENAQIDARILLEYVCRTCRNDLLVHGEQAVTEENREKYEELLAKRAAHMPLQYLTGTQDFMGLVFEVNEHVLIPRQDTEILVEEAMLCLHDGMRILDMCTGSGCILLSLLHYSNNCSGVGADSSGEALQVAQRNCDNLGLASQAEFVESDLFQGVEGSFDLVVSNPPYIRTEVIKGLMPEVREHEPLQALDGMEDGLYFYRRILAECGAHLKKGGMLLFEIGFDQGEAVSSLMLEHGFGEVEIKKDLAGLDRVVVGTRQFFGKGKKKDV